MVAAVALVTATATAWGPGLVLCQTEDGRSAVELAHGGGERHQADVHGHEHQDHGHEHHGPGHDRLGHGHEHDDHAHEHHHHASEVAAHDLDEAAPSLGHGHGCLDLDLELGAMRDGVRRGVELPAPAQALVGLLARPVEQLRGAGAPVAGSLDARPPPPGYHQRTVVMLI